MKEFICGDCRSKIQENRRLKVTVHVPNKTFLEDPNRLAGSKEKVLHKCPHCRGRLWPFGGNLSQLKDRYVYRIMARNAGIGVWISERETFLISRIKFRQHFLFEELHYAKGPPFGTAFEVSDPIEKFPFDLEKNFRKLEKEEEEKALVYLNKMK